MGLGAVRPFSNDFGGGLTGDSKMELVLNGGEKVPGFAGLGGIINGGGVNISDLLIGHALAGADIADFLEQFIEEPGAEPGAVLETVAVNGKAFMDAIPQDANRPLAELGAALGIDAVADGDDRLEGIAGDLASDFAGAFGLNYREILGSCGRVQFFCLIDVLEVEGNIVG